MAKVDISESGSHYGQTDQWDEYTREEIIAGFTRFARAVVVPRNQGVAARPANLETSQSVDD